MIRFVRCISPVLLCLPLLAASSTQVDRLIPADAELAVVVRDLPKLKSQWASSPWAGLWEDPAMRAFFAPLHRELAEEGWNEKLIEETGYELDEIVALFSGGIAAYVPDMMELLQFFESEDAEIGGDMPIVIMADAGERIGDLEALMLQLEEREAEETDEDTPYIDVVREYRDVAMHIEQRIDLDEPKDEASWAAVGNTLAVAGTPELLQEAINNVLDGLDDGPLTASSEVGVAEHLSGRDAYVYFDLRPMVPVIEEAIAETLAEDNPMGMDPGAVMRALRLDAARASFMTLNLDSRTTRLGFGMTMTSDVGVFRLMAIDNKPLSKVAGIPADAASFSITHFDFQVAWQAVEEIVNAINPMYLAMAGGQLRGWQEAQGVQLDLRGDLLENLESEIAAVQLEPEGAVEAMGGLAGDDQLTIITISDREAFERLVDALKSGLSRGNEVFEKREFLGTTIWTAKAASPDAATPRFAYAITDRHAYISVGSSRALEAVLMARNRDDAPSAWDRLEVKRALGSVPGPVAFFAYQVTDVWMERLFSMMAVACASDDEGRFSICDPAEAPTAEVFRRYLGPLVSTMTKSNGEMVVDALIMSVEGDDS